MKISCLECKIYKCRNPKTKKSPPKNCPRKNYRDLLKKTLKQMMDPSIQKINVACEEAMKGGYDKFGSNWPRVRELIEYAKVLDYHKIGIAACSGLIEEGKILGRILQDAGFQVTLVNCMAGGTTRAKLGFKQWDTAFSSIVCNPLMQAEVLNKEKTELNVMVGLCLGHDVLFIKHSKADVTPFIVKDRVTGHNPIAALYTSGTYYRRKLWNVQKEVSPLAAENRKNSKM